jgi:hypothetical protein
VSYFVLPLLTHPPFSPSSLLPDSSQSLRVPLPPSLFLFASLSLSPSLSPFPPPPPPSSCP